jgi:two-component system, OmpR family, response regulator
MEHTNLNGIEPLELEHVRYMYIIDDDDIQREMIKDYMQERYLFDIKTFETGEAAYAELEVDKPEIIVLDYHLNAHDPQAANGIEVLKRIKQISGTSQVVMFSGEDKLEVAINSMRNGAYDYVVKGESAFNKIEKVINNLGERHRSEVIQIAQKRTIYFLVGVICLIIAGGIIYFLKAG